MTDQQESPGTDVSPADPYAHVPGIYSGESWEQMQATADQFFGADLEKGDALIGVPFAIVRMTFRPGDYIRPDRKDMKGDYVSLDVIVGPDSEIAKGLLRKRITEPVTVAAGEHLVVNEAGTGAYRQAVQYLERTGRIRLNTELPEEGRYGASRFDTPVSEWETDPYAQLRRNADGEPSLAFDVRLLCPRGFRASDYENEYTKTARTRYFG